MAENEGARKVGQAIVVSDAPDVCLTPVGGSMVPVPYSIVAYFSQSIETTTTVAFTTLPSFTTVSAIEGVVGDEAGTGKGVASGSHAGVGYCHVVQSQHTLLVRSEGNLVVFHSSKMEMNCAAPLGSGNTIGTVQYLSSSTSVSVSEDGTVEGDTNPEAKPETQKELDQHVAEPEGSVDDEAWKMKDGEVISSEAGESMSPGSSQFESSDTIGVQAEKQVYDESLWDIGDQDNYLKAGNANAKGTLGYSYDQNTGEHFAGVGGEAQVAAVKGQLKGGTADNALSGSLSGEALSAKAGGTIGGFGGPSGGGVKAEVGAEAVLVKGEASGSLKITPKTLYDNTIGAALGWWNPESTAQAAPDWLDKGIVITATGEAGVAAAAKAGAKAGVDTEEGVAYVEAEAKIGFGPMAGLKARLGIKW